MKKMLVLLTMACAVLVVTMTTKKAQASTNVWLSIGGVTNIAGTNGLVLTTYFRTNVAFRTLKVCTDPVQTPTNTWRSPVSGEILDSGAGPVIDGIKSEWRVVRVEKAMFFKVEGKE